jgi:hypothetical protein
VSSEKQPGLPTGPFIFTRSNHPPEGIHPDLAMALLSRGWQVYPNIRMQTKSNLVVPDGTGVAPTVTEVDLWVPPIGHFISDVELVQLMIHVDEQGGDQLTLDAISKAVLGVPYVAVRQRMQDLAGENSGSANSDLATKERGSNVVQFDPARRSSGKGRVD